MMAKVFRFAVSLIKSIAMLLLSCFQCKLMHAVEKNILVNRPYCRDALVHATRTAPKDPQRYKEEG